MAHQVDEEGAAVDPAPTTHGNTRVAVVDEVVSPDSREAQPSMPSGDGCSQSGDAKCDGCDNCDRAAAAAATNASGVAASQEDVDFFTGPARLMLQAVRDSGERFGIAVAIQFLMGNNLGRERVSNAASKPSFGKGREKGKNAAFWKSLFYQLAERQGFLEAVSFTTASGASGSTYCLTPEGRNFLHNDKEKLPLSFIPSNALAEEVRRLRASASSPGGSHPQSQAARGGLSEAERKVRALLMEMRASISAKYSVAPYKIIGAQTVKELAKRRPIDLATLSSVEGMSEKKVSDHGSEIIKVVSKACEDLKLETNVAAVPAEEKAWLTRTAGSNSSSRPAKRENTPVTRTQRASRERYMQPDSLTLEQVARSRRLSHGAIVQHLSACLEGGLAFEWNHRRLGIDPDLEAKIMGVVEHFKKEGQDVQHPKFRLRLIFEELPPDTDQHVGYTAIRLILARLRYERAGRRLPGSGGQVLRAPPSAAAFGKKRALPPYAPTAPLSAKKTSTTKAASPPALPSPTASKSLFTSSYTPSPRQSSASKASPTATRAVGAPSSTPSTKAFMPSAAPAAAPAVAAPLPTASGRLATPASASTAPVADIVDLTEESSEPWTSDMVTPAAAPAVAAPLPTASGRLATTASAFTAPVADIVDLTEESSEPWTSDMVMRMIKEAGPSGATFESMVARSPGKETALRTLLGGLQEDFVVFTKPAETSGGAPVFLAL